MMQSSRHKLLVGIALAAIAPAFANDPPPIYRDATAAPEARADDLLARLSTNEKIRLLGRHRVHHPAR